MGLENEITTPSGTKVRGRYVLTESGAATPSHDPFNGFCKSDGFPTDSNGNSVNDRDYERDYDAQRITRNIANEYDNRALQTPVIVSSDGIVLSGNGRTMAGMIAARQFTDMSYNCYLSMFPQQYGFTPTDVAAFEHPRVLFCASDVYPYTAETFAMFNAQDIKSQSKTEQAVKMGKLVDNETFHRIVRTINQFDTIGDFYNNVSSATDAINDLRSSGIISQMQYPEMFDGDTISPQAREILENVLIGKAFESDPDAVRKITEFKGIRKNIITALCEISNNIALNDYSLKDEMSQAINLCYQARANGSMHQGDVVSGFARQKTMFADDDTVADFSNVTVLMLADMINHSQPTRLKRLFTVYNHNAEASASGQTDMFSDGVKTKDEIINDVCQMLEYDSRELQKQIKAAESVRKEKAKTSILRDKISQQTQKETASDEPPVKIVGVNVGDFCGMRLPDGEIISVKLEHIAGKFAGIRMKGWRRAFVPADVIVPHYGTTLTLPDWFTEGHTLSDGTTIETIGKDDVTLSDGNTFSIADVLLCA